MSSYLIKDACIINEGTKTYADVLIKKERIEKIVPNIQTKENVIEIDAANQFLLPGVIDDQVHFREPGLTHKATIYTEAKAAVAGCNQLYGNAQHSTGSTFTGIVRR